MTIKEHYLSDWKDFEIPSVTENDYGLDFPKGTPQLIKELKCFNLARQKIKIGKIKSAFIHALKICQLLWADEYVSIQRGKVKNTYFLDVLYKLCRFRHLGVTGPASSAKTYSTSIFLLICFYSAPDRTSGLVSTTSSSDSERRVWGDVKKLHRNARFEENEIPEIGEIVEHLKCVVYNPAKIAGKDFNLRDFRNGIMVVPTGGDNSGEEALNKIMGSKNDFIYWAVDEGPAMPADIMVPRTNLEMNPYFMFIIVGNASYKTDPHGRACEPLAGWGSINPGMKEWRGRTLDVLFLHGEKSPNDIYSPKAKKKKDLMYPRLCNKFARKAIAEFSGNGDSVFGRSTQHYWRFAVGFWMGSDDLQTCLSEAFVKSHNADRAPERWGVGRMRIFAGFDPGFAAGGDANSIMFMHVGYTVHGKIQLLIESDSIEIRPAVTDRKEYAKAVAEEVVKQCEKRGVEPQDLFYDVSADGGITGDAISKAWGLVGANPLSSLDAATNHKYANRVSQYWMTIRDLIATGKVCGFNLNSKYAKDLFERRYVTELKTFKVEKKKDMKKRIGRSPDNGDSFSYCAFGVISSGLLDSTSQEDFRFKDRGGERVARYYTNIDRARNEETEEDESVFASSVMGDDDF